MARTAATAAVATLPPYPARIEGYGLELRPWDAELVARMAHWDEHGFPFHGFDLTQLRDPERAQLQLSKVVLDKPHRHFVAVEDGEPVGRVSVNLEDEAGLYFWAVHVPPRHEGRGVCRRMLAALMDWLEREVPGKDFVLSTNTFAEHAHRAYYALGFRVAESRWYFDRELAERLWKVHHTVREPIARHIRFHSGRWEVRVYVMKRPRGAPMDLGVRGS